MEPVYAFGEDFQRKILALAVRASLLRDVDEAFKSQYFGSGDAQGLKNPRQLIAELIEHFVTRHAEDRPDIYTMDEMVGRLARRMKPAQRQQLEAEWRTIRELPVPDPHFVTSQVKEWARRRALATATLQISRWLEHDGQAVDEVKVRQAYERALGVGAGGGIHTVPLFGQDGVSLWLGDPMAFKITTGLQQLDLAMDGGPRRKEVMYILAPPKGAKTTMLINIALNAVRARRTVAYFSYEMSLNEMLMRMHRNLAKATKQELRKSTKRLSQSMHAMLSFGSGNAWLYRCYSAKHRCAEVARMIERLRTGGTPVDVVVMDYLNIMSPAQREQEKRHALASISREMATLASELNVVLWSAALVKRSAVERYVVRKTDIAEAFEVISVVDGAIAVCGDRRLKSLGLRRLYVAALRDNEDERFAGMYRVDLDRMHVRDATPEEEAQAEELEVGDAQ